MSLIVACVEWGNYQGIGRTYVRALRNMVAEHLSLDHRFVCLTDAPARHPHIETKTLTPGLRGWWNKLELFRAGQFEPGDRIVYLDLDTIVVGPLVRLAASPGIIHLRDWGWKTDTYGSGVMVWNAGDHAHIWARRAESLKASYHGDQDWITHLGGWDRFPPALARSYRYHCKEAVPAGCSVVCFHGKDKPHQANRLGGAWSHYAYSDRAYA